MAETTLITANKTGLASSGEAAVGSFFALILVIVMRKFGFVISESDAILMITAGPIASSYILGALRHWWTDLMTCFQRGTSK